MQGWVVAVTAVAIATGWKLEKGKRRSLKSMQGCEAPTSQELLIPNPLDLILLLAVLEFALLALELGSVLPVQAQANSPRVSRAPRGCHCLLPQKPPLPGVRAVGSSWLQGLQHVPGSGPMSSISFQSWSDVKQGCIPRWVLGALQHHPFCPSHGGGSRVEICLSRDNTSNPC